ncbi:MAG: hypothetical protein F4028_07450 [Acidimicrobiaceae bacterium]|nr:hypothetical protein [Acidimicrobiaceae bacterium]MYC41446.1 hypothetical protein [Acidimicrobiaceae bacterium]MYD07095.1 hypothetical protein [Acidimicrobiaceae bacterium]MYJ98818.1 hypothetical protein [Acidimicrobiaceae bacterium]
MLGIGLIYEVGFVILSGAAIGVVFRRIFSEVKPLTLTNLRPHLVPIGCGCVIAALLLMIQLLSGLWKPIEYALMPVPMIAIFVAIKKREEIRRILNSGRDDWLNN